MIHRLLGRYISFVASFILTANAAKSWIHDTTPVSGHSKQVRASIGVDVGDRHIDVTVTIDNQSDAIVIVPTFAPTLYRVDPCRTWDPIPCSSLGLVVRWQLNQAKGVVPKCDTVAWPDHIHDSYPLYRLLHYYELQFAALRPGQNVTLKWQEQSDVTNRSGDMTCTVTQSYVPCYTLDSNVAHRFGRFLIEHEDISVTYDLASQDIGPSDYRFQQRIISTGRQQKESHSESLHYQDYLALIANCRPVSFISASSSSCTLR
jgi:hypothetical protein